MRIIIAGSRSIDQVTFSQAISHCPWLSQATVILSGGARGVDQLAEKWAKEQDYPLSIHKPDWKRYGRGAGLIRNRSMVDDADALLAIWDGHSRGTCHVIEYAHSKSLKVGIYRLDAEKYHELDQGIFEFTKPQGSTRDCGEI